MSKASSKSRKGASKRTNRTLAWILGILGVLLLALGGLYVGAHFKAGDKVPTKAVVNDVAIGGLTREEAVAKLKAELDAEFAQPVVITDETGKKASIAPLENGLVVDYEAAVSAAGGGRSWNPAAIWNTLAGGGPVTLPIRAEEDQVRTAVAALADTFAVDGTDATLSIEGGKLVRTDSVKARALDVDATTVAVAEAYTARDLTVDATITQTDPAITTAMVDEAVTSWVGPAMSGPVTVKVDGKPLEIGTEQIADATTIAFKDGAFTHTLDTKKIYEATADARKKLGLVKAKDASYKFSGSSVVVVPSVDGKGIKEETFVKAFEPLITQTGDARTASVAAEAEPADFTTAEAEAIKPTEVIGEFTTQFPYASYRNTNLGRAASSVNGSVLMPEEIFSLNDTLGERTAANGYVDGYVINGGVLVKEPGGGISQSATTLYNAGFFAGYEDIEHKPHSLYFPRYPAGREATVYYGALDMRFKNDTQYPAIIQGYVVKASPGNKGSITFKIWSRRTWTKVESTELVKSNFTQGTDRVSTSPKCEPQAPIQGFTVNWKRVFYKGTAVAKTEDYTWTYNPGDKITCG